VVGEGPLRSELEQLAVDLGLRNRVVFLGHRSDIPRLLAAFDVFVMTSKFEPYGVALLEAKAAGCSIVATAVNEVSEIVPDGRAGLLFPSGNSNAMATALLRLSSDPTLREQLGSQALRDAYERHSLDAMISTFQSLYDELAPTTARV
jgi:glycosyltransferase involved in cell wall biosynthesis